MLFEVDLDMIFARAPSSFAFLQKENRERDALQIAKKR